MARTLYRQFDNNEQVAEFLDLLYSKYEIVQHRSWPAFSESGNYSWIVDEPLDPTDTVPVHAPTKR